MAGEDKEILIKIKVDNEQAQKRIDEQTQSIIDLKKANELLKKANKETKDGEKLTADQRRRNTEAIARNNLKIQQATAIRKKAINSQKAEAGSLTNLRNTLATLTAARNKNLVVGSKAFNKANTEINQLTGTIKKAEQGGDDFRRSVGKYPQALGAAASSMGAFNLTLLASPIGLVTAALAGLVAVGRQAFNFFKAYEVVMSKVKAVTQSTNEEFQKLRDSTIEYGESTKFTATEVGQLQLELAKLGKTTEEIVEMTGAILNLAVATDSELGDTAKIVAKTLNQFDLSAEDTTRVTDVMAQSFVSSALDINKFEEAMKKAGPIARVAGKSFEETTAIVAALTDAGVDASTIGTSLRDVFSDLAKSGDTWDGALDKIKNSTNRLGTANKIFGKTSLTVTTLLSENIDKVDDLTESLNNSEGAAQRMADIVGNNLQGDLDRLSSSWEGLIARGSALNTSFRVIVTTITFVIDAIKQLGADTLLLFSPTGIVHVAIKKFGGEIQIFFNDIIIESFKVLQKSAGLLGVELDAVNETINNREKENAVIRAKIAEEEAEQGETAFQRYKKNLTAIFNEEEDAQTNAKLKGKNERNKITTIETEDDTEKIRKATEKRLAFQKEKTFELELFRKERDAEEELDTVAKFEKLKEAERFKRDFLLENTKLIETEREIIIEESAQREIELEAEKNAELKKQDDKLTKDKEKNLARQDKEKQQKEI
jgi:hypothetical protein